MEIIYAPSVLKKLKKINPVDLEKARKKIGSLKEEPLLGKPLKGELTGWRSLKAWPLRIIYSLDTSAQRIYVVAVDYRGRVYRS